MILPGIPIGKIALESVIANGFHVGEWLSAEIDLLEKRRWIVRELAWNIGLKPEDQLIRILSGVIGGAHHESEIWESGAFCFLREKSSRLDYGLRFSAP